MTNQKLKNKGKQASSVPTIYLNLRKKSDEVFWGSVRHVSDRLRLAATNPASASCDADKNSDMIYWDFDWAINLYNTPKILQLYSVMNLSSSSSSHVNNKVSVQLFLFKYIN